MTCVVLGRGKNSFEARPSNKIMVPFRVFFENFRRAPPSFLYGSSPLPLEGSFSTQDHNFYVTLKQSDSEIQVTLGL